MRVGGVIVGVLLVLSLLTPAGVAAAEPAPSGTAAVDVDSGELHVRTMFSIGGVSADEIRVVRKYRPGPGVDTVEQQVPESARDVSTRNMNRRGDTYSWDGTGDIARVSFVAEAADLAGPIGGITASSSQARRGDGFAVVEANYGTIRTDATDVSTTVSVDGEGTAGENVAVLGPHETYVRASANGPIRLVVPAHANVTEGVGNVLDALVYADRNVDAGFDRNETGTYVAVESDLGTRVAGVVRWTSFGDDHRGLDAYVHAGASVDIWQHELIHERKQSSRTTDATRWTTDITVHQRRDGDRVSGRRDPAGDRREANVRRRAPADE